MTEKPNTAVAVAAGLMAAGTAILAIDAFLLEPALVEVSRHDLPVPNLPAAWVGARVVHITDLHYGNPRSRRLFAWMVRTVNALEPDLIVCTGDFIQEHPSEVAPSVEYVRQLHARHGKVAVLGDHDFFKKKKSRGARKAEVYVAPGLCEGLEEAGFTLLRNRSVELPGGLHVAGVDPGTRKVQQVDLDTALAGLNGTSPHLLLAHSPDIIKQAAARKLPMALCGHTHGGQVVVPFYGPPITHIHSPRRFASGWSELDGTRMYTTRGLGSHYSLRFLCRPEIAVFTLKQA